MADEQRDVDPQSIGFEPAALRREIDGAAAVGIHDDGGDTLREKRLRLTQRLARESFRRMRVDVDEARGDQSIPGVDDAAGA